MSIHVYSVIGACICIWWRRGVLYRTSFLRDEYGVVNNLRNSSMLYKEEHAKSGNIVVFIDKAENKPQYLQIHQYAQIPACVLMEPIPYAVGDRSTCAAHKYIDVCIGGEWYVGMRYFFF